MSNNHFFEKKGPFPLKEIIKFIGCNESISNINNITIHGFESLNDAKDGDMTFLNSSKYKDVSPNTKALACITTTNLTKYLPNSLVSVEMLATQNEPHLTSIRRALLVANKIYNSESLP